MNNKHKEMEEFIENTYKFKEKWNERCSKYNINEQPSVLPAVRRIVVIGDIHGDLNMMKQLLKAGGVIDNDGKWTTGKNKDTVVVQVGDQIDRCRFNGILCKEKNATENDEGNDWVILQYMTKLHSMAQEHGGAVYSLLGNHELMNVDGDFRYVSYAGFKEFEDYKKPDGKSFPTGDYTQENGTTLPYGAEAREWAFKPGNPISEFLACTRLMAITIGSNLFVHAGILPKIAKKYSVKNLNQLMSLYLWDSLKDNKNSYNDVFNASSISPLWNRVYGKIKLDNNIKNMDDNTLKHCSRLLDPLEDIYKVNKIFVGHTPLLENGIGSGCKGRVWLTDFGASAAFDKFDQNKSSDHRSEVRKAQVLEILKDGDEINVLK
jgi:hypothetical protein